MTLRDLAAMALINVVWALNSIIAKAQVTGHGVPPLWFAALRCVLIATVVSPWLFPLPRQWRRLIAAAFLIGGGSFGVYVAGLRFASASSAAIVSQISLPITTILSVVMLGEVIRWRRMLGIVLAFVGTLLVVWDPHGVQLSPGLLLVVLSSLLSSLGAVLMKQVVQVRPLQFQAWAGLSAVGPLLLLSLLFENDQVAASAAAGWALLGGVLFSALVTSVGAHTAYYALIQRYEANLIAPMILLSPVLTVLFGVWLLGEGLPGRMLVGAGLTLAGVLVIALRPNRAAPKVMVQRG